MRLVLYTGKGGVGKTTTAAATAACAAERGRRTLVASADAAHSLGDVLERRLGPEPTNVAPHLDAIEIDPRAEMERHWGRIRDFLIEVFVHQGIDDVVAEELAMLPGAEEITTLLAIEGFAESGRYDFVIVDCAPTDSALRLATLPDLAHRALKLLLPTMQAITAVGTPIARKVVSVPLPGAEVFKDAEALIYDKFQLLRERITDSQTSIRLVVTPERVVIEEARRAYTELALFEVPCDAVVMNRLLPAEAAREEFFNEMSRLQEQRFAEVEQTFAPLPVLRGPLFDDEVTGVDRLAELGRSLFATRRPDAVLSASAQVRFRRDDHGYRVEIPLPRACADEIDVAVVGEELAITIGGRRRLLALPRQMARLAVETAKLEGTQLVVRFGPIGSGR
ncbi:MAG: ArsA family ATPase [Myxococcota bacterium]